MKKVLNKLIMSTSVCFSLVSMLVIIDKILGISINFYIYLLITILTLSILGIAKNVKKVLKILIMSAGLSFSLTSMLMIVSAVMRISISFNFYLLLFAVLTLGLTLGLIAFDSKKIFMKNKVKRTVKRNKARTVKTVDSRNKVRKKIS